MCLNKHGGEINIRWMCYWKVENNVEFQRRWRIEFGTPPPTRVTITRIRDKFEVDAAVQICWNVDEKEIEVQLITRVLMQLCRFLPRLPKKSLRQCSRENGIEKSSVNRILRVQKWYSISNNPDGMSLCSTLLLAVYCGRRWTFSTSTGLRKFKESNTTQIVFLSQFVAEK